MCSVGSANGTHCVRQVGAILCVPRDPLCPCWGSSSTYGVELPTENVKFKAVLLRSKAK